MEEERDRRLLGSDRTAGISRKLLRNIIKIGCQAEKRHANVSHLENKSPSQGGPVTNGNTESLNTDRYSSATVPDLHRKHKKMIPSKPKIKKKKMLTLQLVSWEGMQHWQELPGPFSSASRCYSGKRFVC